jgi:hypothetical protein
LAGKMKSRRNALSHGLSLPLPFNMEASAKVDAIVRALTPDQASDEQLMAATEVAQAQLELQRIRAVRAELVARVASGDLEKLQRLAAVDRYERLASRKRRRASRNLRA